jgi:hypothetical protein
MPNLLSGSLLRRGGSGDFIDLAGAQPQLPPTDTTATGYSLITDGLLRTSYRSSLGYVEFRDSTMWSALTGTIAIVNSGTAVVSTGTNTGLLVVKGDIGVGGTMNIQKDIIVNGLTIGQGYEGRNNIVVRGTALPIIDNFENGQESIAIGYNTLMGIATSYKNIAIGRNAISTGTEISNNIAIGDSALTLVGTSSTVNDSNIGIGTSAGAELKAGQYNVFIGHEAADVWQSGNYNIIIGQNTALFINTGSGIISIGGDNLVDGVDNQVNIGSVFYYDGTGYSYIAADTEVGLGSPAVAVSASTMTGGLVVVGGIAVYDNAIIAGTGTSTSTTTGAVVVTGGVGIRGDVYARTGAPDQDYLLYTPRVFTTSTEPTGARIADIWIDETVPAYLQYIKDGTSTFWIQVGAV